MDRIRDIAADAIDGSQFMAVLIGEPQTGQRHIGIWYRADDAGNPNTLHLAWHCRLKNVLIRLPVSRYGSSRRIQSAACVRPQPMFDVFGRPTVGVQYRIRLVSPLIRWTRKRACFCWGRHDLVSHVASFVLAVFHGARLPLIDYPTWRTDRHGDREWQEQIIEQLKRHGAEAEHIEHVRSEDRRRALSARGRRRRRRTCSATSRFRRGLRAGRANCHANPRRLIVCDQNARPSGRVTPTATTPTSTTVLARARRCLSVLNRHDWITNRRTDRTEFPPEPDPSI